MVMNEAGAAAEVLRAFFNRCLCVKPGGRYGGEVEGAVDKTELLRVNGASR